MKLYLSSYEIGDQGHRLPSLAPKGRIGYVPNARDFTGADPVRYTRRNDKDIAALTALGLDVRMVDLRDHFHRSDLETTLDDLGALFVSGGNVFVLRQAMKLSGLDELLLEEDLDPDFLYAGYSAAGCVLAPDLSAYQIVDPVDTPYEGHTEVIWGGLGIVDFAFMPHWDSDHPESESISKEIAYCEENGIPYRAIRDGEVIIIE